VNEPIFKKILNIFYSKKNREKGRKKRKMSKKRGAKWIILIGKEDKRSESAVQWCIKYSDMIKEKNNFQSENVEMFNLTGDNSEMWDEFIQLFVGQKREVLVRWQNRATRRVLKERNTASIFRQRLEVHPTPNGFYGS
jgi:hypothetical protein